MTPAMTRTSSAPRAIRPNKDLRPLFFGKGDLLTAAIGRTRTGRERDNYARPRCQTGLLRQSGRSCLSFYLHRQPQLARQDT
jgi:hypothetical protein